MGSVGSKVFQALRENSRLLTLSIYLCNNASPTSTTRVGQRVQMTRVHGLRGAHAVGLQQCTNFLLEFT